MLRSGQLSTAYAFRHVMEVNWSLGTLVLMRRYVIRILIGICFMSFGFYPFAGDAAITLPWSCDFESCEDWVHDWVGGQPLNCCNGLESGGHWTCNGQGEEINSTRGWRDSGKSQVHYAGTGVNVNSGGLFIRFPSEREIWFRYYISYERGYKTNGYYDKHIYINLRSSAGPAIVCEPRYYDRYGCLGANIAATDAYGVGWKSKFSDYRWHWVEIHLRFGSSDGIYELWIDGDQVIDQHNVTVGTDTNRYFIYIASYSSYYKQIFVYSF